MRIDLAAGCHRAHDVTGITMEQAALSIGKSRTWISSMIWRNNPTARNIEAVADAYEIPLGKFIEFCLVPDKPA